MYAWLDQFAPDSNGIDTKRLRQSLGAFPTGVCLVTTVSADGKREGMTINSFASVSLNPALVLWSMRDDARSADAFLASEHFVISVLGAHQQELAMDFARPAPDKFVGREAEFDLAASGCPRLLAASATFECRTYSRHHEGDHTILIGKIEAFSASAAAPLIAHGGRIGPISEFC